MTFVRPKFIGLIGKSVKGFAYFHLSTCIPCFMFPFSGMGQVLVVAEPRKAEAITGGRTLEPKVAIRLHHHTASIKLLRDFNSSSLIGKL